MGEPLAALPNRTNNTNSTPHETVGHLYYTHRDHLSSLITLTTAAGRAVERRSYSAFGQTTSIVYTAQAEARSHTVVSMPHTRYTQSRRQGKTLRETKDKTNSKKFVFRRRSSDSRSSPRSKHLLSRRSNKNSKEDAIALQRAKLEHVELYVSRSTVAHNDTHLRRLSLGGVGTGADDATDGIAQAPSFAEEEDDEHLIPVIDIGFQGQETLATVDFIRFSSDQPPQSLSMKSPQNSPANTQSSQHQCGVEDSTTDSPLGRYCSVNAAYRAEANAVRSRLYDPRLARFLGPFPVDLMHLNSHLLHAAALYTQTVQTASSSASSSSRRSGTMVELVSYPRAPQNSLNSLAQATPPPAYMLNPYTLEGVSPYPLQDRYCLSQI